MEKWTDEYNRYEFSNLDYFQSIEKVKQNPFNISQIWPEYRTLDVVKIAIKGNFETAEFIPEKIWENEYMYKELIEFDGRIIKYAPDKILDYNLIVLAVKNNQDAIECIPDRFCLFRLFLKENVFFLDLL